MQSRLNYPRPQDDCDPAIDRVHLKRQTLGDALLAREVLDLFADQAGRIVGELRAANDSDTFRKTAHYLKGSARAIGAQHIAALAGHLEVNHWQFQSPAVATSLAELQAQADAAVAEIKAMAVPF